MNDPDAEDSGEDLLKKYWLDAIERPCYDAKYLSNNNKRKPNKKLFTVRFCE